MKIYFLRIKTIPKVFILSKKRNLSFIKNSLLVFTLYFFYSCNKQNGKAIEPCLNCPVDFRVTDFEPAWSPDGKYIAYVHGDTMNGKTGIYLITPEGKENHLWHAGIGAMEPTWSPDGGWIAFSDGAQIWKKKLNGDSLVQLTKEGKNFFPSWNPDGNWIAYERSYSYPEEITVQGIWVLETKSGNTQQIFSGNSGYPFWVSANQVSYIRGVVSQSGNVLGDSIFTYSFTSNNIFSSYFLKGENTYLKYSSASDKIAFSQKITNKFQIWIINGDGSNLNQLTNTQGYSCDWSPEGKQIVYTDSRAINGRLWIMNADGSAKKQLTF